MKDFLVLKLLDKISFIFIAFGIDYAMMRKILMIKLIMDERKVPTVMMSRNNSKAKGSFRSSLLLYALIGFIIGIFMLVPFPLFIKINIIIGMILFMIMTTMISDFSSVLLDVDDKKILLVRPVDPRTLNAAKLIHIIIYLFSLAMAISGGSLILGLSRYGFWFFLVFLFVIALICGFVILFTSFFHYAILTIFNGETLKDIINYFQIILTVCTTVMSQFIGRLFDVSHLNMNFSPHWWDLFLPSAWFAAPFSLLMEHAFNRHYSLLSLIGIIMPVITLTLYIRVVAPRFEKKLQKLNNGSSSNGSFRKRGFLQRAVSNVICFHPLEKVFFRFTVRMLANERKLKLKLYPGLALSIVMPLIFFLNFFRGKQLSVNSFAQMGQGKYYLFLYFSIALLLPLFSLISTSENYKGAWIYKALPVENPAMVLKGAFKGFLYKFIIPVYLFLSLVFLAIFGFRIIIDLTLIFINLFVLMLIIFRFSNKELPFYKDFQYTQNGDNIGIALLSFGSCGGAAALHYGLGFIPFGIVINIGISLIFAIALWHFNFKISWNDIIEDSV